MILLKYVLKKSVNDLANNYEEVMKYIDKLHEESIIYEKRVEALFSIIF